MNIQKNISASLVCASLLFLSATTCSAFVKGDVDADGVVRPADALLVLRYVAGTQSFTFSQLEACDVGGGSTTYTRDFRCDIVDNVLILYKAYGLISF
jgi:Dockerin type I domain